MVNGDGNRAVLGQSFRICLQAPQCIQFRAISLNTWLQYRTADSDSSLNNGISGFFLGRHLRQHRDRRKAATDSDRVLLDRYDPSTSSPTVFLKSDVVFPIVNGRGSGRQILSTELLDLLMEMGTLAWPVSMQNLGNSIQAIPSWNELGASITPIVPMRIQRNQLSMRLLDSRMDAAPDANRYGFISVDKFGSVTLLRSNEQSAVLFNGMWMDFDNWDTCVARLHVARLQGRLSESLDMIILMTFSRGRTSFYSVSIDVGSAGTDTVLQVELSRGRVSPKAKLELWVRPSPAPIPAPAFIDSKSVLLDQEDPLKVSTASQRSIPADIFLNALQQQIDLAKEYLGVNIAPPAQQPSDQPKVEPYQSSRIRMVSVGTNTTFRESVAEPARVSVGTNTSFRAPLVQRKTRSIGTSSESICNGSNRGPKSEEDGFDTRTIATCGLMQPLTTVAPSDLPSVTNSRARFVPFYDHEPLPDRSLHEHSLVSLTAPQKDELNASKSAMRIAEGIEDIGGVENTFIMANNDFSIQAAPDRPPSSSGYNPETYRDQRSQHQKNVNRASSLSTSYQTSFLQLYTDDPTKKAPDSSFVNSKRFPSTQRRTQEQSSSVSILSVIPQDRYADMTIPTSINDVLKVDADDANADTDTTINMSFATRDYLERHGLLKF